MSSMLIFKHTEDVSGRVVDHQMLTPETFLVTDPSKQSTSVSVPCMWDDELFYWVYEQPVEVVEKGDGKIIMGSEYAIILKGDETIPFKGKTLSEVLAAYD